MENFKVTCTKCGSDDVELSVIEYDCDSPLPNIVMFECNQCGNKEEKEC